MFNFNIKRKFIIYKVIIIYDLIKLLKFYYHNHPFHLVTFRPWPLYTSLILICILVGLLKWFHEYNKNLLVLRFISLLFYIFQWWRDVVRERTFQGIHTKKVVKLIRLGIILFIISEVFFFISFFWRFFHMSLSPRVEIGGEWPPKSILIFNPYSIPLLNTIILLSSGITITWRHYRIIIKDYDDRRYSLFNTIILGVYFSYLQFFEYKEASFSISDSVYGSTFYLITGFHGFHVIIGTLFIFVRYFRLNKLHFSLDHHFGFEARAWYWHFVDIIWLLVYILIYWWFY